MVPIHVNPVCFLQRALLALCLILLGACSSPSCREWGIQINTTRCPQFNSGRLFLNPESDQSYIELEIVRSSSGLRMYINILFLRAMPYPDDPTRTKVEIFFEEEEDPWLIYPYIFEGGQRLLIPKDVSDYLIQVLQQDRSFTLKIGRFETSVVSAAFSKVYLELMNLSIEEVVEEKLVE